MYVHLLRAPFLTYHPIPFFPLLPAQLLFIFIFNIWNHFLLEVFPASLAQSKFGLGMCLVIPSTLYLFYFSTQLAALPTCLSVFTVLPIKKCLFAPHWIPQPVRTEWFLPSRLWVLYLHALYLECPAKIRRCHSVVPHILTECSLWDRNDSRFYK